MPTGAEFSPSVQPEVEDILHDIHLRKLDKPGRAGLVAAPPTNVLSDSHQSKESCDLTLLIRDHLYQRKVLSSSLIQEVKCFFQETQVCENSAVDFLLWEQKSRYIKYVKQISKYSQVHWKDV